MPSPAPSVRMIACLLAVGHSLAAAGCASRVVDVTEPVQNQRHAAAEEPEHAGEYRSPPAHATAGGHYGDPRQIRTADGRPAPYGRDPDTGRAINDPLPPPRQLPPPRMTAAGLPMPVSARSRPAATPAALTPARGGAASVVVAKGDTLHSLARRHNVGVDDLKRANGLSTDQIRIGQKLTIPGA